jgi:cell division protein FtsB
MLRLKVFYNNYLSRLNAYWLVIIVFIAFTFTVGESSLYKRYTYDERIRNLEKEIGQHKDVIDMNRKKLHDLRTNKEGLERFAREEYFMKKPDEEVFIIKKR